MQHFEYEWKSYDELSKDELYAILRLRQEVFIVGQKINYVDCDNVDQNSHHLMTLNDDKLVGYLRMIPPGHKYENACAFGRLAVVQDYRGQGISKNMLLSCIEKCETLYPDSPLKMSAQYYLLTTTINSVLRHAQRSTSKKELIILV